jgi:hypothetical protein
MKLLCRWDKHAWFPWSDVRETKSAAREVVSMFSFGDDAPSANSTTVKLTRSQERMCSDCRIVERRVISEAWSRE